MIEINSENRKNFNKNAIKKKLYIFCMKLGVKI